MEKYKKGITKKSLSKVLQKKKMEYHLLKSLVQVSVHIGTREKRKIRLRQY